MSRVVRILVLLLLVHVPPARSAIVVRGGAGSAHAATPPVAGRVLVVDDAGAFQLDSGGRLRAGPVRLASLLERHGLARGAALARVGTSPSSVRFFALESTRPGFEPERAAAELRA